MPTVSVRSLRLPNVGGCNSIAVSGRLLACMKTGVVQSSPMSVSHFVLHAILSLRSFVAQASLFKSSICTTRISLCCAKSSLFSVVSRVVFRHVNKPPSAQGWEGGSCCRRVVLRLPSLLLFSGFVETSDTWSFSFLILHRCLPRPAQSSQLHQRSPQNTVAMFRHLNRTMKSVLSSGHT